MSDEDWDKIAHLFPRDRTRRYGRVPRDPRELLNAILWVLTQTSAGIICRVMDRLRRRAT
ncbi:transposase [Paraburkholderia diazotrophica]|uniref:transposase n=1 Tax=Paraburkholderia diazotrophica TaxID=667676 RepID=UPI003898E39E